MAGRMWVLMEGVYWTFIFRGILYSETENGDD